MKDRSFEANNSFPVLDDSPDFIGELQVRKRKLLQFQVGRLLVFFDPFEPFVHTPQSAIHLPQLSEHFGQ